MYSQELIDTVRNSPAIQHVHFTASGDHFFQVYEHRSGGVYGRFLDGIPDLTTAISKTVYRDEILNEGGDEVKETKQETRKSKR